MNTRLAAVLSILVATSGCASINPFEYTAKHALDGPYAAVCWGRVNAPDAKNPCDKSQSDISLNECVAELEHAATLYTPEEEKRELLFECMFRKGWQEIHMIDWR